MNLHEKLLEIRKTCPYLKKENPGYNYKYVSSSQTLAAFRAKMDELGVLLVPEIVSSRFTEVKDQKGNPEYFTELEMKFTWVDVNNPGDTLVCHWAGQGVDNKEKGVGKALTYAEKYFLLKTFNVATDKDDPDAWSAKNGTDPTPPEAQGSPADPLLGIPPRQKPAQSKQAPAGGGNPSTKQQKNMAMIAANKAGKDPNEVGAAIADMSFEEAEAYIQELEQSA